LSTGDWKLIEYVSGETQLFDLQHDPMECRNKAGDPSAQELLSGMRRQLVELARIEEPVGVGRSGFWKSRADLAKHQEQGKATGLSSSPHF